MNKYENIYNSLIDRSKNREIEGYTEKHHNSRDFEWAREKFSKSIRGSGNGRYGKPVSNEYLGIWHIQRECAKDLNLTHTSIGRALRNNTVCKGYTFQWI